MKRLLYIFFCFISVCLYTQAQNKSIIDDLNTAKSGEGKIVIYQDEAIKNLVGTNILNTPTTNNSMGNQLATDSTTEEVNAGKKVSKNVVRARGYRIQVFSGNDQKRSKNEAYSRKSSVQSAFPNMDVSITYKSPVWRVRAGNFKTYEQATQALNEMKARFPGFGREMHVVDDVVRIAVD
jgi:hypothetical protein